MRYLFTDGFNSMWHFIFGLLSVYYTPILILFLIYQVVKHNPISSAFAGLLEFFIGYVFFKMYTPELLSRSNHRHRT